MRISIICTVIQLLLTVQAHISSKLSLKKSRHLTTSCQERYQSVLNNNIVAIGCCVDGAQMLVINEKSGSNKRISFSIFNGTSLLSSMIINDSSHNFNDDYDEEPVAVSVCNNKFYLQYIKTDSSRRNLNQSNKRSISWSTSNFCFVGISADGSFHESYCISNQASGTYGSSSDGITMQVVNCNAVLGTKNNIDVLVNVGSAAYLVLFDSSGFSASYIYKTPGGRWMKISIIGMQRLQWRNTIEVFKVTDTKDIYNGVYAIGNRMGGNMYKKNTKFDTGVVPQATFAPVENGNVSGVIIAYSSSSDLLGYTYYYGNEDNKVNYTKETSIFLSSSSPSVYFATVNDGLPRAYICFNDANTKRGFLYFNVSDGSLVQISTMNSQRDVFYITYEISHYYLYLINSLTYDRSMYDFVYPARSCLYLLPGNSTADLTTLDDNVITSVSDFDPQNNNDIESNDIITVTMATKTTTVSSFSEINCIAVVQNGTSPILKATVSTQSYSGTDNLMTLIESNNALQCKVDTVYKAISGFTISATVKSGSNTASWASIDTTSAFLSLSSIPYSSLGTVFDLSVSASDSGLTANAIVTINSTYINQPPQIVTSTTDQSVSIGSNPKVYDVTNYFSDPENKPLTITSTLQSGSGLPSWVVFSNSKYTITPNSPQTISVILTATDDKSQSKSQNFNIAVVPGAPVVNQTLQDETTVSYKTYSKKIDLTNAFNKNGATESLNYNVVINPNLFSTSISENILLITGTPTSSDVCIHTITITATNSYGSCDSTFKITVTQNKPPIAPSCPDISTTETTGGTYTVPVFTDPEGDTVTYSVKFNNGSALASWITFSPVTRVLVYHSPSYITSPIQLLISAADTYNPPTTVVINYKTDFAPKDNSSVILRSAEFICFSISTMTISKNILTDEDSNLSYSITYANGTAAPSWLNVKLPSTSASGDFEFSGTYPAFENVLYSFKITATDSKGQKGSAEFYIQTKTNCNTNCNTCFGPNVDQCTDCYSGRYLYISLCGLTCPTGYYPRSSDNTCQACDQSCSSCTGSTNADCTICNKNSTITYFSYEGTCINPCPSKYYGNTVNQQCTSCHSYCTECYGGTSTQCTACNIPNRYVYVSPDTCQYLECPSLTYYNSTTYDCKDCNTLCGECYGESIMNCLTCTYSRFLASDHSCKLCNEIDPGLKFEPLMNTCLERCGKGFNLGFLECDDGNLINGDGCSSSCKVELNFRCSGGNSTTKDTCINLIKPVCEFSYISSTSYLGSIAFSETVVFNEFKAEDITITIDGPLSPYTFKYLIDNSTGFNTGETGTKFYIKFTFLSSLMGSYQETITIKFLNEKIVQDLDENYLGTTIVTKQIPFFLNFVSDSEKQAASSQSAASLVSMLLTFGTSILISTLMGGTIEATWLLLGTVQLMSFVPLFNMNLPSNFREFSKNLALLNGEPQSIPNLFEYVVDSSNQKPYNNYFEIMNFKTNILVLNSGRKIEIWFMMICSMGVSFILFDLFGELGKIGKLIRYIDMKLRYGMFIRAITQAYLSITLSSILNMYTISWSGSNISYTQNVIAIFGMLAVLLIPVKCYNIIFATGNLNDPQFQRRYKTFISDLKTDDPLAFQFLSVFFFRRAVYASIFVLFSSFPSVQIGAALFSTFAMFMYLLIVRPYISSLSKFLCLVNEVLLFVLILPSARFINPTINPDKSSQIGLLMVGIIAFTIFINWVAIIIYGVFKVIVKKMKTNRVKKFIKIQEKMDKVECVHGDISKITHCRVIENPS